VHKLQNFAYMVLFEFHYHGCALFITTKHNVFLVTQAALFSVET